jgi:hypothetical protein
MLKINQTVWRETRYIAVWVLILSALMQAVFLIIQQWEISVLWGNLLSAALAIGNFLLLGVTVQQAVEKQEKDARSLMRMSQSLRMLLMFAVLAIGVALPIFNTWACIIPVFFVRIALFFRPKFGGMQEDASAAQVEADGEDHADGGDGIDA